MSFGIDCMLTHGAATAKATVFAKFPQAHFTARPSAGGRLTHELEVEITLSNPAGGRLTHELEVEITLSNPRRADAYLNPAYGRLTLEFEVDLDNVIYGAGQNRRSIE
jgi:hypothetical protein